MYFRLPGEDGIVVDWKAAYSRRPDHPASDNTPVQGHAYVRFPANAQGQTFSVYYSSDRGTDISAFQGAVEDFGENYDTKMSLDTEADLLALLERLDRERPMPHPGVRTGQIWGIQGGGGFTTLQIIEDYDGGETDPVHPAGRWFTLVCGSAAKLSPTLGDRRPIHVTEERLRELLTGFVLIADPVCPHLAPWSPV